MIAAGLGLPNLSQRITTLLFLSFLLFVVSTSPAISIDADYSATPIEKLIEDLRLVDSPAPGIGATALFDDFIAEEMPPRFVVGILGSPSPRIPPQMRELVRRGVQALPALIRHLDDKRPTKLSVGGSFDFKFRYFSDEYDARDRSRPRSLCENPCLERAFDGIYVVKVGDVCYAVIGQIVNRLLVPVRYQPTAGLIVNSPIEAPSLAERIEKDWGNLDARSHAASLLADIRADNQIFNFGPALARLRFYYPDTYMALHGDDLKKREAFESDEKAAAIRN